MTANAISEIPAEVGKPIDASNNALQQRKGWQGMEIPEKDIIAAIRQGLYASQIAKKLHASRSSITRRLKKMEQEGKIVLVNRSSVKTYEVATSCIQSCKDATSKPQVTEREDATSHTINEDATLSKPSEAETLRQEAVWYELPLSYTQEELNSLSTKLNAIGIKNSMWALANNYPIYIPSFRGCEVKIYTHSLMILPPDNEKPKESSLPSLIQQETARKAWEVAEELISLLELKCTHLAGFPALYLVREELEQTNNPSAKDLIRRKLKVNILHPGTEDICFQIDESPVDGIPGKDSAVVRPDSNPDHHLKTMQFYDDLLHHDAWATLKEDREILHESPATLAKVVANQSTFSDNLAEHVKLIKRLNSLIPVAFAAMIIIAFIAVILR